MGNHANTLKDQGKVDKAAKMENEVPEKRRRILGEQPPDTIEAMNNLPNKLGTQGQIDDLNSKKKNKRDSLYARVKGKFPRIVP